MCGCGGWELRGQLGDMAVLSDLAEHGVIVDAWLQKAPTKGIDKQAHDLFVGIVGSSERPKVERWRLQSLGGSKEVADRLRDLVKVLAVVVGMDEVWG